MPTKCRYVTEELGFDACLDRREPDLAGRLRAACPDGVDIYVELAGGEPLWAVLPLMNLYGRIPVIGGIANYNLNDLPQGPGQITASDAPDPGQAAHLRGMIVWDFAEMEGEFRREVSGWLRAGSIRYREDVADGLENAPQAFIGMLEGRNFGKQLVRVSPDPTRPGQ